ncbi:MAG TPA: MOSC domain-containing protein [Thermoanaerobaculia bacterium]|jgi:MOSC domain-containing protein YiiM
MKVIAVSVGLPREVAWRGRTVRTSIFKEPVEGPVRVGRLNLAGDRQSDLTVHGGAEKAVYVYPAEHYAYWRQKLGTADLPWGSFGENLTTEGLDESIQIGDRLKIGTASFVVTQPRMPCYKLALRFDRLEMVKWLLESGRTGFYLSVAQEGELSAGDTITLEREQGSTLAVADVTTLYARDAANQELLKRASEVSALPEAWREYFRERLWEPDSTAD